MEVWTIIEEWTQPIIENPPAGQPLPVPEVIDMEVHKNLQSDYTRSRQDAIEIAIQLVGANPKALTTIKDTRIQNAVAKQMYGVDTYAQLIAVYGENFHTPSDEENLDKTEKLEREVRILRYKSISGELDNAVESYRAQNANVITSDEDEAKLRDELKYISAELPIKERIKRASAIVFGANPSPNSVYRNISVWTSTNWGNGNATEISKVESNRQIQIEAGRKLLGLK